MPELPGDGRSVSSATTPAAYDAAMMTQSPMVRVLRRPPTRQPKLDGGQLADGRPAPTERSDRIRPGAPAGPRQSLIGRIGRNNDLATTTALWPGASFAPLWTGSRGQRVDAVIEAKGLKQMNDTGALEAIVDEVLAANAKSVENSRAGGTRPSTRWSVGPGEGHQARPTGAGQRAAEEACVGRPVS